MNKSNSSKEDKTLHEAVYDLLISLGIFLKEEVLPRIESFISMIKNEAIWLWGKIEDRFIKQSETSPRIKDVKEKFIKLKIVNDAKTALLSLKEGKRGKKILGLIAGIATIVCLVMIVFGGGKYDNDRPSSIQYEDSNNYDWLYGTWEAYYGNIRDEITITSSTITHANIYEYDFGSYRIDGNTLFAKYSNDPSGIVTTFHLNPNARKISSDGISYRNIQ